MVARFAAKDVVSKPLEVYLFIRQWKPTVAGAILQTVQDMALRCGSVRQEYDLRGIFLEGLRESLQENTKVF